MQDLAREVIERCRAVAESTEEPGHITRTFLSAPMREVHRRLSRWMTEAGMSVAIDAAGNLRGSHDAATADAPRLFIGSHLDTVPRGGAFDGVLGVMMGIALVERLAGQRLRFAIEVIGFSEEEGVRFGTPFIGSRAFTDGLPDDLLDQRDRNGITVREAIRQFGLDPSAIGQARATEGALGYLEFHIEQGPVLESLGAPVGIVESIAGQSRFDILFTGRANHAGTTPMTLRRDALAGAVEWISRVESEACSTAGLVATVGRVEVEPGAGNVIPGVCRVTLDARHAEDRVRLDAMARLRECSARIAAGRGLDCVWEQRLDQAAVPMDASLVSRLEQAVMAGGSVAHRMTSGAGHDAMIVAARMPAAMLFVRSPGGVSHHPDETVQVEDVAAALDAGWRFLQTS